MEPKEAMHLVKKVNALFLLFILMIGVSYALPTDKEQIMHVTADTADLNQQKHKGIYTGNVVFVQGTTNLQNPSDAVFFEAAKFSGLSGSGTTSVLTTLQNTYENSVDPEIVTNATRGAIAIKRGSGADTDNILEGLNGAGTATFTLKGNGALAT